MEGEAASPAGRVLARGESVQIEKIEGPIPPPWILKEYESILPGSADRIVSMAEGVATHKQGVESRALDLTFETIRRGQLLGAAVVLFALIAGVVALITGYEDFAETLISTTLVALAAIFVLGRVPGWFGAWRSMGRPKSSNEHADG